MKRPDLNEVSLDDSMNSLLSGNPSVNITMNQGQWDDFLALSYERGFVLIELDRKERPVKAYRRKELMK